MMDQDSPFANLGQGAVTDNTGLSSRGSWLRFTVDTFAPSVDINMPPLYKSAVRAERSDGVTFTVPVLINKQAYDLVTTPKQALDIAVGIMQQAMRDMGKYRDCACKLNQPCKEHQR